MAKLNKTLIEKLELCKTRYKTWDDEIKGFAIETLPSGNKTFQFFYTSPTTKKFTYLKIGNYGGITCDSAREIALEWKILLAKRIDPKEQIKNQPERTQKEISLLNFLDVYIKRHVKTLKPSTVKNEINRIGCLKKETTLCAKSLESITPEDILSLKNKLAKTPIQFNRLKETLNSAFNRAKTWKHIKKETINPCAEIKKYKENKRKIYLTVNEINKIKETLLSSDNIHNPAITGLLMIISTGCRHGEIRLLRWDEVSLKDKCLHLKDSKTGSKTIPLNETAIKILKNIQKKENQNYVFPGKIHGHPIHSFHDTWNIIREKTNLKHVTIHDLRHTFASLGIKAGLSLYDISKLLGHSNISTTMRYAHLQQEDLIKASNKIDSFLDGTQN